MSGLGGEKAGRGGGQPGQGASFRLPGALGAWVLGGSPRKTLLCTGARSIAAPSRERRSFKGCRGLRSRRGGTRLYPGRMNPLHLSLHLEEQGAPGDQGPAGRRNHSPQFLSSSPLGQSLIPSQTGTHKPFTEHRNSPGQAVKPPESS